MRRSIGEFGLPGPAERWRALREHVHADVCRNGFDAELNSFVQSYGAKQVDASLLLLPLVGFLPADDPRITGTVAAIERFLLRDCFVSRYNTESAVNGLPGNEGAFLACSFWLADNYILQRRYADARRMFERLLDLRNDVGLLAEEYDPRARRQVPQAFSHVALINTAHNLTRALWTSPTSRRERGNRWVQRFAANWLNHFIPEVFLPPDERASRARMAPGAAGPMGRDWSRG